MSEATLMLDPDAAVAPEGDATMRAARLSAERRTAPWARRSLSPGVNALLWTLRLYVVLMLGVVAVQFARLA